MSTTQKADAHVVTPRPVQGWFEVTSATSGKTYVVVPLGGDRADCTCAFGRNARIADPTRVCSHVLAVRAWAAKNGGK